MLKELLGKIDLHQILVAQPDFVPFPPYQDRVFWSQISQEVKSYYITHAAAFLNYDWPSLKATAYLEYVQNGNRSHFEKVYFDRNNAVKMLLIAECLEGSGRFINDLINGVWLICEESTWILPAHAYTALPDLTQNVRYIDLFSAETASLLTFVHYFLKDVFDQTSPYINQRIRFELQKRIIEPFLKFDDMPWMGFGGQTVNNWNPWIISNVLPVFLLLEESAAQRVAGIQKCLLSLDNFINEYAPDGGCDEGPQYWTAAGASMFDCLEFIFAATNGRFSVYDSEKIKNIGRYIHRTHIANGLFVNFEDGGSKINPPCALIYQFGKQIGDATLTQFGATMLAAKPFADTNLHMYFRSIQTLILYEEITAYAKHLTPVTAGDVWLEDLEYMAFRERPESESGFFLAAKGGHNDQSHNHNDVGNLIVYYNGIPILIDPGVEMYTAKTFSAHRYEIWTMQSSFHSLPEVNGRMQQNGLAYRASNVSYQSSQNKVTFSLDIAGSYPKEAGLLHWQRSFELKRQVDTEIIIREAFELTAATDQIVLNYMTLLDFEETIPGAITFALDDATSILFNYDASLLEASKERIPLEDERIKKDWGTDHLYRLQLSARTPLQQAVLQISITRSSSL
ncbi:MAG: heparinase II/III family protein [Clostridia bacterium]